MIKWFREWRRCCKRKKRIIFCSFYIKMKHKSIKWHNTYLYINNVSHHPQLPPFLLRNFLLWIILNVTSQEWFFFIFFVCMFALTRNLTANFRSINNIHKIRIEHWELQWWGKQVIHVMYICSPTAFYILPLVYFFFIYSWNNIHVIPSLLCLLRNPIFWDIPQRNINNTRK